MTPHEIYHGSDGEATKALYRELEANHGPAGAVATNLFRAQKSSSRAKVYRGRNYKGLSYEKKNWSMDNLCRILGEHAASLGITWGWKIDPAQEYHNWVLYVDTPVGQASFHAASRGKGPDYGGEWDRSSKSEAVVIRYVDLLLGNLNQVFETPSFDPSKKEVLYWSKPIEGADAAIEPAAMQPTEVLGPEMVHMTEISSWSDSQIPLWPGPELPQSLKDHFAAIQEDMRKACGIDGLGLGADSHKEGSR
jgi:hypothetical protein